MVLSSMLIFMSAWSLNTFTRLNEVSKTYGGLETFSSACELTEEHVATGLWISRTVLPISVVILLISSYQLYRTLT